MVYSFGVFQIDTVSFRLTRMSVDVSVEPKVFDLIVFLIRNRDRMVSRQEIFDHIWNKRVVSDAALSTHIRSARMVLDDDGKKQDVVKTVFGRGFQFVAMVTEPLQPISQKTIQDKKHEVQSDKSIAVLAFADLSSKQDQEFFSDGISEELLNLLSRIPDLKVISRTSSFSFKGRNITLQEIGEQLKVSHVLEGSVRKHEDDVRITVQLIEVASDSHVWSETYQRKMGDIFDIQYDIAQTVTRQLKSTLMGYSVVSDNIDADAYTLFLKANYYYHRFSDKTTQTAEKLIRQSLEISNKHAPSWCLLSKILYRATSHFNREHTMEWLESAKVAVEKSLELDYELASAWAQLSIVELSLKSFDASKVAIDRAMELDGKNPVIIATAAGNALDLGRLTEAVTLFQRAIQIDPLADINYYNLGIAYLWLDSIEDAEAAINMYDQFRPDASIQHVTMSAIYLRQGKLQEALIEAQKEEHPFWKLFALCNITYSHGNKDEADNLLQQFKDEYGATSPVSVAAIYAHRSAFDDSFLWLEKGLAQQDMDMFTRLNFTQFRVLYDDARWGELVKRMHYPEGHVLL